MNEMFSIEGKVAVISGAAGALGGSLARHFASQGADVVALVHRPEQLEPTVEALRRLGGNPCGYACNVMDTGALKGIAAEVCAKFGRVDSRTDIWQMGILLYEVLMHRLPFHTKDIAEIGMAITLDGPEYGDAPEWVLPVLQRALTQEKDGRFATADEFADALEAVIPEEPEVPEEPEAEPAPEQGDDAPKAGPTGLVEDEFRPERAKAKYDEGMDLLESGDPDNSVRALELITESSDMGYVWAQGQLAYMLLTGNGASINVERAIELYRKAADQGDEDSMYNLGLMYAQGKYLEKDMKAAKKWLNKAIIKGDYGAQRVMNMIKKLE